MGVTTNHLTEPRALHTRKTQKQTLLDMLQNWVRATDLLAAGINDPYQRITLLRRAGSNIDVRVNPDNGVRYYRLASSTSNEPPPTVLVEVGIAPNKQQIAMDLLKEWVPARALIEKGITHPMRVMGNLATSKGKHILAKYDPGLRCRVYRLSEFEPSPESSEPMSPAIEKKKSGGNSVLFIHRSENRLWHSVEVPIGMEKFAIELASMFSNKVYIAKPA